jgi:hypothetical protein
VQLDHSGGREPRLSPVTELGCDLPAIGLVADDDHRLAAPLDRRSECRSGRAGRERVTRLARGVKGVRQSLAGLARSQERTGQDRICVDPLSGKLLAERPRLLAARGAEAAQLVRFAGLGIRVPDEKEPQTQAGSRAGNSRGGGPTYSADGRMILLSACCSSTCADQPATRLAANSGVNRSVGTPR